MSKPHPTAKVVPTSADVTALVIVGPPASGKSTIRSILEDYGAVGCELDQFHDDGSVVGDWESTIRETVFEASRDKPCIAVIEGAIVDEEVDFVRDLVSDTLVVLVQAPEDQRLERYIDRESPSGSEHSVVSEDEISDLRLDALGRYFSEIPYPQEDVTITNTDDLSVAALGVRCANIVSSVSDIDRDSLDCPVTINVGAR